MGGQPGHESKYCPNCGEQNHATAEYCQRCGQQFPGPGGGHGPAAGPQHGQGQPPNQGKPQGGGPPPEQPPPQQPPPPQSPQQPSPSGRRDDGKRFSRRQILGGTVLGLLALLASAIGLAAMLGPTHRLASEDAVISHDETTSGDTQTITGELELPSGRYLYDELTPQGEGRSYGYELDIQSSEPIDVLTIHEDEFSKYEDEDTDFDVVEEFSERGVTDTTLTTTFEDEEEYRLVYDNTELVGAEPSGTATVEYELDATV